MRLLTAISIASLVVSIAAVVLVLGLYAGLDKSEPDTPQSTVSSPKLTEKEAVALARMSAVGKTWLAWAGPNIGKPVSCENELSETTFDAKFDANLLVWTVTSEMTGGIYPDFGQWEVYEKFLDRPKGAVVSVGREC